MTFLEQLVLPSTSTRLSLPTIAGGSSPTQFDWSGSAAAAEPDIQKMQCKMDLNLALDTIALYLFNAGIFKLSLRS